jgi:hypothetical protein
LPDTPNEVVVASLLIELGFCRCDARGQEKSVNKL